MWPGDLVLEASAKMTKGTIAATTTTRHDDGMNESQRNMLFTKPLGWVRELRDSSTIRDFSYDQRQTGPVKTAEMQDQSLWWIKRTQQDNASMDEIEKVMFRLKLHPNDKEVLRVSRKNRGRIPHISSEEPLVYAENHGTSAHPDAPRRSQPYHEKSCGEVLGP